MADGTDQDEARAARMDEWIAWEVEERGGEGTFFSLSSFFIFLLRGTHTPSLAHSASLRVGDFFC